MLLVFILTTMLVRELGIWKHTNKVISKHIKEHKLCLCSIRYPLLIVIDCSNNYSPKSNCNWICHLKSNKSFINLTFKISTLIIKQIVINKIGLMNLIIV